MKADTFAKLVVLETLIDSEVGCFLAAGGGSPEGFREGLVAAVSDLIDEIDQLDSVAAARVYDAVVDFLAELPEEADGVVEATLRFKRAVDRLVRRGMPADELGEPSTWAVVVDELLEELADAYHLAVRPDGQVNEREYLRARAVLARVREAADRMLWSAGAEADPEFRTELDRVSYAVRYRRLRPTEVDHLIRAPQRRARRFRPSSLTRIGAFVVGQLLRRGERAERPTRPDGPERRRR
jgi:hypothetical protein